MIVEQTSTSLVVTLPLNVDIDLEEIQRFLRYLRYKELVAQSQASQEDIDQLAREVNKSWWEKNKHRSYSQENFG